MSWQIIKHLIKCVSHIYRFVCKKAQSLSPFFFFFREGDNSCLSRFTFFKIFCFSMGIMTTHYPLGKCRDDSSWGSLKRKRKWSHKVGTGTTCQGESLVSERVWSRGTPGSCYRKMGVEGKGREGRNRKRGQLEVRRGQGEGEREESPEWPKS